MNVMGDETTKKAALRRTVTHCPVCDTSLYVSELACPSCDTRLRGAFMPPPLARLSPDQQEFVLTFVRCRGIIRDVERVLGISYPTVRARLDAVARSLDTLTTEAFAAPAATGQTAPPVLPIPPVPPTPAAVRSTVIDDARRLALLEQVEQGILNPAEAIEALHRL